MASADVVGGQGEPGAIRFRDALRQLFLYMDDVFGAAIDALLGVEAVGHAHGLGCTQGQHHQAAYPGLRGGARLPERFLIAHGSQQAPIQALGLRSLTEMLFIARQALLQVLGKGVGADVAEYVDVAVVAFFQALQAAILLGALEEGVDLVEQAGVFAGCNRPAQAA
ncbi:hypothetical protein FQZ97_1032270 [compost metagenome]